MSRPNAATWVGCFLMLALTPCATVATSLVTQDETAVSDFQLSAHVLGFDELPPNGGGGANGAPGVPIEPESQVTDQYSSFGLRFSSSGGPCAAVSVEGLPNENDAHSPFNLLGGSDTVGGVPRLNYFEPIVIDIVDPATGEPATTDRVGAWNDPTGSRMRLEVFDAGGDLLESAEGDQGFFVGIQHPDIARAVFSFVQVQSVPGFALDDVSVGTCILRIPRDNYGTLLFGPLCTRDAVELPAGGDVYDSTTVAINKAPNETYYVSSSGLGFTPLVVDDVLRIDAVDSGLGPYDPQPGVPPFVLDVPIEQNLLPVPAHDVSDLIAGDLTEMVFELADIQGEIYGNTVVYLVRDCGIVLTRDGDTIIQWISHDVEVVGVQSDLEVVSGTLSELLEDGDFSRACRLGAVFDATDFMDTRPNPSSGEGYYYLVSGTCATPIGYGNSSQGPRLGLPPALPCP